MLRTIDRRKNFCKRRWQRRRPVTLKKRFGLSRDLTSLSKRRRDAFDPGAALVGDGMHREAIAEYEHALRLKSNPQVRLNLGLAYYKAGEFVTAAETLRLTHKEIPQNVQAVTLLADCLLRLGRNKEVIDLVTPLQRDDPDNQAFVYLLGTALVRNGEAAKGQWIIDKILKNGDRAESRLLMGTTKYMAGDFAEARRDFEKAADLNPHLPDVFAYYGMALLATGDQAAARKAFGRELQLNPNNFDSNLRLGVLLRQDEDNAQALKYLQRALNVRPSDPGVRFQIASLELSEGHLDTACRDLESLVKDNPNFIEAHVTLATVYFRQNRKADGVRERAIFSKLNAARRSKQRGGRESRAMRSTGALELASDCDILRRHQINRLDASHDSRCMACHSSGGKRSARICKVSAHDCVSCHMPKIEIPGSHHKFTDHDIRIARAHAPYPD